ncbi:MAG: YebC/PmpR family DNA-binding transcriptional regulator [Candidatus Omnitrophota bacterium]
MSGHSHWASIKHKKGKADAQRGKVFSRIGKQITIAARSGGDISMNSVLRAAVDAAREVNMPQENITRAIKKGTGELPGVTLEQCTYEAYGPGGIAFIIEMITDNKNRASSEMKHIFSKFGGNLAAPGAAMRFFKKKGVATISIFKTEEKKEKFNEEELMEITINTGAEDFRMEDEECALIARVEDFNKVKEALKNKNIQIISAKIEMLPENPTPVADEKSAGKMLQLVEALEEHDDVQDVYANFDIPDELMDKLSQE